MFDYVSISSNLLLNMGLCVSKFFLCLGVFLCLVKDIYLTVCLKCFSMSE